MKMIIVNGSRYDLDKITFIAFKKLFPGSNEKDFTNKTGRKPEKKKIVKSTKKETKKKDKK